MITKEEFRKTFIRMMDEKRENYLGEFTCSGVDCRECLLTGICNMGSNAYEVIESVQQWAVDHPIITNEDKIKEVFGINQDTNVNFCPFIIIGKNNCIYNHQCNECKARFWHSEYKKPEVKKP